MLANAHAPQNHRAFSLGKRSCHFAQSLGRNAANRRHSFRAIAFDVIAQCFVIAGAVGDKGCVGQAFFNHRVDERIEHGHIGIRLELQSAPGVLPEVGNARVGQYDFGAALGGVFHPGGSHRVVGRGIGANDKNQICMFNVVDLVTHRARAHAFEQSGHTGGVAQAGAVVYVVAAKAGAHQLLEQIGLFIAAFGRAKTSQRFGAIGIAQTFEPTCGQCHSFFPRGFAKHIRPIGGIAVEVVDLLRVFAHAGLANQRYRQALRAGRIVKTKAAFDAQAAMVGRAVATIYADDDIVFDVVSQQATDAAKRTHRIYFFVHHLRAHLRLGHQRARGAGLHTFAASNTAAVAHWIVQIKDDFTVRAAHSVADDIVHLFFAASTHAAIALDASIQIHRHRGVRIIRYGLLSTKCFQCGTYAYLHALCPEA